MEIGTWCVVEYDGAPYPGVITQADETDVEVDCMCRVGPNRFFWPMIKDLCWYSFDRVMSVIEEPKQVTKNRRHFQVDPDMWRLLSDD